MNNYPSIAHAKGYRVLTDGTCVGVKNQPLRPSIREGYRKVAVSINGRKYPLKVSRLQAFQKFGDAIFNPAAVVRHLDGNSLNDSEENIGIGTQAENMQDIPKSVRVANALRDTKRRHDHRAIIEAYRATPSYRLTCEKFGICKAVLHFILNKSFEATTRATIA